MNAYGHYRSLKNTIHRMRDSVPESCRILERMLNHTRSNGVPKIDDFEAWVMWILQKSTEEIDFAIKYDMSPINLVNCPVQYENNEDFEKAVIDLKNACAGEIDVWYHQVGDVYKIFFQVHSVNISSEHTLGV